MSNHPRPFAHDYRRLYRLYRIAMTDIERRNKAARRQRRRRRGHARAVRIDGVGVALRGTSTTRADCAFVLLMFLPTCLSGLRRRRWRYSNDSNAKQYESATRDFYRVSFLATLGAVRQAPHCARCEAATAMARNELYLETTQPLSIFVALTR